MSIEITAHGVGEDGGDLRYTALPIAGHPITAGIATAIMAAAITGAGIRLS